MGRRKKGLDINGWLVVDKPLGMSSATAVAAVRRITKAKKVGHAGTLDPLATGVLPIGLGEATKTMPFIVDASKTYEFTISFGRATNTDDAEGETVATSDHIPSRSDIAEILPKFTGTIQQVPPAFSAIKVDGKRAYALARGGDEVKLAARPIDIHHIEIIDFSDGRATLRADCGKGTYIRSLGRDIALALNSVGFISMLRRVRVGPFDVKASISLEKLEQLSHSSPAESYMSSVMTALADIPALALTEEEASKIRHGMAISDLRFPDLVNTQGSLCLTLDGNPVAIARHENDTVQPLRVFNM